MKCYIYFITNKITNQIYVGQTTNYSRRKREHFTKLQENRHPNQKLQNSYNQYGENNFTIHKIQYDDITKEELDNWEKYYIKECNSYLNGFNLTEGGTGGDTRSKLNFEDFCFAYFGNLKYKGMTTRTGKYLNVDSACIAAIARKESYDSFREKADLLDEEKKQLYIQKFEKELDVLNNKPWTIQKTLDEETTFIIMCIVSCYGRGIEKAILNKFNLSKGFIFHLMTGKGRQTIKEKYSNLSKEEIIEIGHKFFNDWEIQKEYPYKLKEEYVNLNDKYNK